MSPSPAFPVCITGAADKAPDAGPGESAEAHGARFRRGDKFTGGQTLGAEIKVCYLLLGQDDGNDLGMDHGAVALLHKVYSRRHKPAAFHIKNRCSEGAATVFYVLPGETDNELHPFFCGEKNCFRARDGIHDPFWQCNCI